MSNRIIDQHYAFISNKKQLVSFNHNGHLTTYFFPNMDAHQNLDQAYKWVQLGMEAVPLTRPHFDIEFAFNDAWDRLVITYSQEGLKIEETYGFDAQGNRLNIEVSALKGRMEAYHCFYAWQLTGSTPFHGIVCDDDGIEVFKHELRLTVASEQIQSIGVIDPQADNAHIAAGYDKALLQRPDAEKLYGVDAQMRVLPPSWPRGEFLSSKLTVSFQVRDNRLAYSLCGNQIQSLHESAEQPPAQPSRPRFCFLPPAATAPEMAAHGDKIIPTSLAVLNMLQGENGAILASYEQDEVHGQCGGYGFCWGRDGAFIADAMKDHSRVFVKKIFDFLFMAAQPYYGADKGAFLKQRYQLNGLPAPGWGDQYDETGSLLWIYAKCQRCFNEKSDLADGDEKLPSLVDFLLGIIEPDLFLFQPSIDIWEERFGYHLYSQMACLQGLSDILQVMDEKTRQSRYPHAPQLLNKVRASIEQHFFINGLALRSILRAQAPLMEGFNDWQDGILDLQDAPAHLSGYGMRKADLHPFRSLYEKGFVPDFTPDISNLAVIYPFAGLNLAPDLAQKNIAYVDHHLLEPGSGLHFRYDGDPYIGGNAWVLATLWLGISETLCGQAPQGRKRLAAAGGAANGLGLLPEQVDGAGQPCWIQPLGWSHAFYLILADLLTNESPQTASCRPQRLA